MPGAGVSGGEGRRIHPLRGSDRQNTYPERQYDKFDDLTWNLAVVDYGGALGRCQQHGIRWS